MTAALAFRASVFGTDTSAPPTLRLVSPPPAADFEQVALAYAERVADHAARRLAHDLGSPGEADDIRQQLLLDLLQQWSRFDADIASPMTFVSMVIQRRAISILRSRCAAKRGATRRPSSLEAHTIDGEVCHRRRDSSISEMDGLILRLDVRAVVAGLPPQLQHLCRALMGEGVSAAARALGIRRHVARAQIDEIQRCFVEAGFESGSPRRYEGRSS
jgi:DNA-directed RNA polymerase specialized sigma24 family protein